MEPRVRQQLLARTENRCGVCGKQFDGTDKIVCFDIYPTQIAKWTKTGSFSRPHMRSNANKFMMHRSCCKQILGTSNYTIKQKTKFLTEKAQEEFDDFSKRIQPAVSYYQNIKNKALSVQQNKCIICERSLSASSAMLRRRSQDKDYTPDNAMAVCYKCNDFMHYIDRQYNRSQSTLATKTSLFE